MTRISVVPLACLVAGVLLLPADVHAQWRWWGGPGAFAAIRVQVEPKEAEVFIDGYYAGIVDDFDGYFQRLHLEPGEYEIEIYSPGHRSFKRKIYVQPATTFRIRETLTAIGAGDTPDPRPVPAATPPGQSKIRRP